MAYTKLYIHLILRTYRSIWSIDEDHEKEFYYYIYSYATQRQCKIFRINGMPDHIHIFASMPPTFAISDFVHDLKLACNSFMERNNNKFPDWCGWGKSFCAISYSIREKDQIINYIKNQKTHHESISTYTELETLIKENEIEYDPAFLDINTQ